MPKYGKKLLQNVSRTRIRIPKLKYPLNFININMLKYVKISLEICCRDNIMSDFLENIT